MFQDFNQLARFTSATPRKGGFNRVRDLSLPKVDRNHYGFNTDKTNTEFSTELIVTTTGPATGDLHFMTSLFKYSDVSELSARQRKGRELVHAYLELYLQLGPFATFQSQTKDDYPKFSLIEFLVERTAGFTIAQSIFGMDTGSIDLDALRTWSFEHGIDQDELSFLFDQAGPIQAQHSEARMSRRFSNLQEASVKRQEGLQIL